MTREIGLAWAVGLIFAACIALVAWVESVPGELEGIPMSGARHYRNQS